MYKDEIKNKIISLLYKIAATGESINIAANRRINDYAKYSHLSAREEDIEILKHIYIQLTILDSNI